MPLGSATLGRGDGPACFASVESRRSSSDSIHDPRFTDNQMELMAAVQGLLALKERRKVEITTDAEYRFYGITKWMPRWKRRYWLRKE
jgi:ribonuclease HI